MEQTLSLQSSLGALPLAGNVCALAFHDETSKDPGQHGGDPIQACLPLEALGCE